MFRFIIKNNIFFKKGLLPLLCASTVTTLYSPTLIAGFCTDAPIDGGLYKLVNEGSGINMEVVSLSSDEGAGVIQRPGRSSLKSQQFTFSNTTEGTWTIEALHSRKLITASEGISQQSGDNALTDAQKWQLRQTTTGSYKLVSIDQSKLMASRGPLVAEQIISQREQGTAYENWYLNPVNADCQKISIRLDGGASPNTAFLSWEKIKGNLETLEIHYANSSEPSSSELLTTLDLSQHEYRIDNLENDTEYWFWVKYKVDGFWKSSNAFKVTPHKKYSMLSQLANPIKTELDSYKDLLTGTLAGDMVIADNIISWQLDHGGFYKNKTKVYNEAWDGEGTRSKQYGERINAAGDSEKVELGSIDNDATVKELLVLADVYQRSGEERYREATRKALDFLINMQYNKGGWPQVYPARVGTIYSNYVTFNDNAMVRVMYLLDRVEEAKWPLNGDLFTGTQRSAAQRVTKKGVKYIRRAQIFQDGQRTVWSAQHDPQTYAPLGARSFELPSKNGKASSLIAAYLMSVPQTQDVAEVVEGALAWFRKPEVQATDTKYIKRSKSSTDDTYNPIQEVSGKTMWYRFYDLETDAPFFSGRQPDDNPPGKGKQYNIMDIEAERRYGYEWGGSYGSKLLKYAKQVGY